MLPIRAGPIKPRLLPWHRAAVRWLCLQFIRLDLEAGGTNRVPIRELRDACALAFVPEFFASVLGGAIARGYLFVNFGHVSRCDVDAGQTGQRPRASHYQPRRRAHEHVDRAAVLAMRQRGLSFRQIAREVQCSVRYAWLIVSRHEERNRTEKSVISITTTNLLETEPCL